MWKSVENAEQEMAGTRRRYGPVRQSAGKARAPAPLRACSACAGDYEDPERTAGMFDEPDDEESDESLDPGAEELPADEH
jgi:hypothetical protein